MDEAGYVAVALIASFNMVRTLTDDVQAIRAVLRASDQVTLSPDGNHVRANLTVRRHTLLVRCRGVPPEQQVHRRCLDVTAFNRGQVWEKMGAVRVEAVQHNECLLTFADDATALLTLNKVNGDGSVGRPYLARLKPEVGEAEVGMDDREGEDDGVRGAASRL